MSKTKTSPKRRRVWLRRFVVFLCFGALLWFAPAIVALTPLRTTIAQSIFADLKGTVSVGGASLGWLSPVVLRDVALYDEHGQLVLRSPKITSVKSTLELLKDKVHLGHFRFDNPTIHWRIDKDNSNIERVFAAWLFPTSGGGGEGVDVSVEFQNAVLHIYDETADRQWRVDPVHASLDVPNSARDPFRVEIDGKFNEGVTGVVKAKLHMEQTESSPCEGKAAVWIERLPMELVQPLVRRFAADSTMSGRFDCKVKLIWQEGKDAKGDLSGSIAADDVNVSGSMVRGETLQLSRVIAPFHVSWQGDEWVSHGTSISCDIGTITAQGGWRPSGEPLKWLARPGLKLDAKIDLAKLAEQLPKTLHLQEGTKLLAGKVSAHLETTATKDGVVWKGEAGTSDLQGVNKGQFFVWKNPIALTCRGTFQPNSPLPTLEQFDCKSAFLNAQASGDGQRWKLHVQYDLDRLAKQLAPFIKLNGIALSGNGATNVTLDSEKNGLLFLQSDSRFNNLVISGLTERPIQEKSVIVFLNAAGERNNQRDAEIIGLRTANVRVQIGADQVDAVLLRPIADLLKPMTSPIRFRMQGDLARWQARLEPYVPALKQIMLGGYGEFESKLQLSENKVAFDETRLTLRDLQAHGYGMRMNEKLMQVSTSGSWDAGRLKLAQTNLTSSAVSLQASSLNIDTISTPLRLDVAAKAQGDLARLQQWLQDPSDPSEPLRGRFDGAVNVASVGSTINVKLSADMQQFARGPAAKPSLQLASLKATGQGVWDTASDSVTVKALRLETPFALCDANGKIEELSLAKRFTLAGKLTYDWKQLQPMLAPYVGTDLQISGKGTKPFELTGSLSESGGGIAKWVGSFEADWQSASAHGVHVGPAVVRAKLQDGWLRCAPIDATMNDGRVSVSPHLQIQPGPLALYIVKGKILDNVKITPKMCANVLQYLSPALNGMAEADGNLSMDLDYCRVDLHTPATSRVAGKMTLHAAKLAATPLIRDLAVLLKTKPSVGIEKESVVKFQLYEGRMYHENLGLVFPNVTVRTRGSIGLDGKLALLAEFPAPQSWFGDRPIGKAIAKQMIRIPIGGTVDRPQLDRQALANITRQFFRNTAGEVIRNEIEDRLKRLFGPK